VSTPENSSLVKNKLKNAIAILKLIEDRDGPQALDKPGGADLVSYTTYENAAGVVRNMLEDLYNEIDRQDIDVLIKAALVVEEDVVRP
jgi:hypothetical protein